MPPRRPLAERFWEKVDRGTPDQCWEWTAARNEFGYGCILVEGRKVLAHRVCWELECGPIPPGLSVCHRCDNPPCNNPAHLFIGEHIDNMRDRDRKGRLNPGRGERARGAARTRLTWDDVRAIRARYAANPILLRHELATEYGIDQTAVERIVAGKTWREPGMLLTRRGKRKGNPTKLNAQRAAQIRGALQRASRREVAQEFGISLAMVSLIATGKAWREECTA